MYRDGSRELASFSTDGTDVEQRDSGIEVVLSDQTLFELYCGFCKFKGRWKVAATVLDQCLNQQVTGACELQRIGSVLLFSARSKFRCVTLGFGVRPAGERLAD